MQRRQLLNMIGTGAAGIGTLGSTGVQGLSESDPDPLAAIDHTDYDGRNRKKLLLQARSDEAFQQLVEEARSDGWSPD